MRNRERGERRKEKSKTKPGATGLYQWRYWRFWPDYRRLSRGLASTPWCLLFVGLEGGGRVVAAEAECVAEGDADFARHGFADGVAEIAIGIELGDVDRRRDDAMDDGEHGRDGFGGAGGAQHMACHALRGCARDPARPGAEHGLHG